jgi:hypothetical protein
MSAARVIAGRVPSYELARQIEQEHDARFGFFDRAAADGLVPWQRDHAGIFVGAPDPGPPLQPVH